MGEMGVMMRNSVEEHRKLWESWTQASWHAWLKDSPEWRDLLLDVVLRLPWNVQRVVASKEQPVIFFPPPQMARVVRLLGPLPSGALVLQLDALLMERPRPERLAILAHEIAHLCLDPSGGAHEDDFRADALAAGWGYRNGLIAALERDLGADHERALRLRRGVPLKRAA